MSFEAFRYEANLPEELFLNYFLSSFDFDLPALQGICGELGMSKSYSKQPSLDAIKSNNSPDKNRTIIKYLIRRTKSAIAFRAIVGNCNIETARNAEELLYEEGKEEWYGPIKREDDSGSSWYIHPLFFDYIEREEDDQTEEVKEIEYRIRWLCFARVCDGILSLHWHGFTYRDALNKKNRATFPYWQHIPKLFKSIEGLLETKTQGIKLHEIVLFNVLTEYRKNPDRPEYQWADKRIRAEAGGVAISARSGSDASGSSQDDDSTEEESIDLAGLTYLADVIWKAVQRKLEIEGVDTQSLKGDFVDEILLTLIQKYGSKSYEMRLFQQGKGLVISAHCYFGMKRHTISTDSFPHLQLKQYSKKNDLEQLLFLLSHFDRSKHLEDDLNESFKGS